MGWGFGRWGGAKRSGVIAGAAAGYGQQRKSGAAGMVVLMAAAGGGGSDAGGGSGGGGRVDVEERATRSASTEVAAMAMTAEMEGLRRVAGSYVRWSALMDRDDDEDDRPRKTSEKSMPRDAMQSTHTVAHTIEAAAAPSTSTRQTWAVPNVVLKKVVWLVITPLVAMS